MTSIIDALPFEIIAIIIELLASDEEYPNRSLKSCSLACQTFLPLCRERIFYPIGLKDIKIKEKVKLLTLIQDNPKIADYVRELHYAPSYPYTQEKSTADAVHLQKFTKLISLILSFEYRPDWERLPPIMRSIILSLMRLPTIISVSLQNLQNMDPSQLASCATLHNLQLDGTFAKRIVHLLPICLGRSIKVRTLSASGASTIKSVMEALEPYFGDETPILDFGELEVLTLHIDDPGQAGTIFKYTHCLQRVYLTVDFSVDNQI